MRVIALVDGAYYPAVARAALERLATEHELVAVPFVGGEEKGRSWLFFPSLTAWSGTV